MVSFGKTETIKAEESYDLLKSGDEFHVVNAAFGRAPRFLVEQMLVVEGLIENKRASVLRNSGYNTMIVRIRFVPDKKLT